MLRCQYGVRTTNAQHSTLGDTANRLRVTGKSLAGTSAGGYGAGCAVPLHTVRVSMPTQRTPPHESAPRCTLELHPAPCTLGAHRTSPDHIADAHHITLGLPLAHTAATPEPWRAACDHSDTPVRQHSHANSRAAVLLKQRSPGGGGGAAAQAGALAPPWHAGTAGRHNHGRGFPPAKSHCTLELCTVYNNRYEQYQNRGHLPGSARRPCPAGVESLTPGCALLKQQAWGALASDVDLILTIPGRCFVRP